MAEITVTFPVDNEEPVLITRRTHHDLPQHVVGNAEWFHSDSNPTATGYYISGNFTDDGQLAPIEFVNNDWYGLQYSFGDHQYYTSTSLRLTPILRTKYQLGYWRTTEPQHPAYRNSRSSFRAPLTSIRRLRQDLPLPQPTPPQKFNQ